MAIDREKVQKALEDAKRRTQRRNFAKIFWWRPRVGTNTVRIMPPWTEEGPNAGQFWREIYTHWSVGEGGYDEDGMNFSCPNKTPDGDGEGCLLCPLVAELYESGSAADVSEAGELRAKGRAYSNIVDLKDPTFTAADIEEWEAENDNDEECPFEEGDTKVQVWAYGVGIFKELLDYFMDIDLADLEEGRDVTITREGKGKYDTEYRVKVGYESVPFEIVGDLDKLLVNLDELFPFPDPERVQKVLSGSNAGPSAGLSEPAPQLEDGSKKNVVEDDVETAQEEEVEIPECFEDVDVFSESDPLCVGGEVKEDGVVSVYDKCPVFDECKSTIVKLTAPKKTRRRSVKKEVKTEISDKVAALEEEIRNKISGRR